MFVLTARNAVSGGKIIYKRVCLLLIHSVNHWTKQCTFPHENVSLPDTFFTCTNLTLNAVFLHKRVVLWCSLCYSFWPFIFFWLTDISFFILSISSILWTLWSCSLEALSWQNLSLLCFFDRTIGFFIHFWK